MVGALILGFVAGVIARVLMPGDVFRRMGDRNRGGSGSSSVWPVPTGTSAAKPPLRRLSHRLHSRQPRRACLRRSDAGGIATALTVSLRCL
jgi:hypothetical protein